MPETLPFDIIMKILKMRPRDKDAKSLTSDCIREEFDELLAHIRFIHPATSEESMHEFFVNRFFFWYRGSEDFERRHKNIRPRDKSMMSYTSILMKKAIKDAYPPDVHFHIEPGFSVRYFCIKLQLYS